MDAIELWPDEEMIDDDTLMSKDSNSTVLESRATAESHSHVIHLYSFFMLMFQTMFRLSDTALNTLLNLFGIYFSSLY